MRCKFCFASFQDVRKTVLPKGHLTREHAISVVSQLAGFGFEKITFAGGEPTLCPWLPDLIKTAKNAGLTTMLVTNGSELNDTYLEKNINFLDWIALSVDSLKVETNLKTGRAITGKTPLMPEEYYSIAGRIKSHGYGFKVNTVVNRYNVDENMSDFILHTNPKRWKIFQVLPMLGQNDLHIDDFTISEHDFNRFIKNHEGLKDFTTIVSENNVQMKGTYAMVDPAGRFYDNVNGTHNYSKPILEVGVDQAIREVSYSFDRFIERGGQYDWKRGITVQL